MSNNQITPQIIFMGGLQTNGQGDKAHFLAQQCSAAKIDFHVINWQKPGDGTISKWLEHTVSDYSKLPPSDNRLVISTSMGSWMNALLLRALPDQERAKIKRAVMIAPAFDIVDAVVNQIGGDELRNRMRTNPGMQISIPAGQDVPVFQLEHRHIEDAGNHNLLPRPAEFAEWSKHTELLAVALQDDRLIPLPLVRAIFHMWQGPSKSGIIVTGGHYQKDNDAVTGLLTQIVESVKPVPVATPALSPTLAAIAARYQNIR